MFCQSPVHPATKARLRRAFELSVIPYPWIMDNLEPGSISGLYCFVASPHRRMSKSFFVSTQLPACIR